MTDHLAEIITGALIPYLRRADVTDVSIQSPGELWVNAGQWSREAAPSLTRGYMQAAIDAIGNRSRQSSSDRRPLLSAELPRGERVQAVRPPASEYPIVVVRNPSRTDWTLECLAERGAFGETDYGAPPQVADGIRAAHAGRRWLEYLSLSVRRRRNILVSGSTGSGKTTLLKALAHEIPIAERLITIEDVRELSVPHENAIRLRYSKGDQGTASIDPGDLLEACLRMRPDRILFGEVRGGEAFQFLRSLSSGHPGSLTSIHASNPLAAIDQLALLARQSEEGRGYGARQMRRLAARSIDVVVQMEDRKVVAVHDCRIAARNPG